MARSFSVHFFFIKRWWRVARGETKKNTSTFSPTILPRVLVIPTFLRRCALSLYLKWIPRNKFSSFSKDTLEKLNRQQRCSCAFTFHVVAVFVSSLFNTFFWQETRSAAVWGTQFCHWISVMKVKWVKFPSMLSQLKILNLFLLKKISYNPKNSPTAQYKHIRIFTEAHCAGLSYLCFTQGSLSAKDSWLQLKVNTE